MTLQTNILVETSDVHSILYTLKDSALFDQTGYRILEKQTDKGFLVCNKTYENDKIKLIYDTSRYMSLEELLPKLDKHQFSLISSNLFKIIKEVEAMGFLKRENIVISSNRIFVDANTLKVYIIYLPIKVNKKINFEDILKNMLVDMKMRYSNIYMNPPNFQAQNTVKEKEHKGDFFRQACSLEKEDLLETANRKNHVEHISETKKGKNGAFYEKKPLSFINRILHKWKQNKNAGTDVNHQATEILDELFIPKIMFVGIETPVNISIVIDKPSFIIGKNPDAADGKVLFNKAISRTHCKVVCVEDAYYLVDLSSANGTFVNGERVKAGEQKPIGIGDKVTLANSSFIIKAI